MLMVIYFHGIEHPLAKKVEDAKELSEVIIEIGEHRIEKLVVLDLKDLPESKDTVNSLRSLCD